MKLKKNAFIVLFLITIISYSQQVGDGYAPVVIADFSAPQKSGIYNGLNTTTSGMAPDNSNVWQHLFVMRHTNQSNNYQLQLASSFAVNDRLFFRKIVAGDLSPVNTAWIELATRGANTFNGNQNLIGNQTLTGNFIIGQEGEISTIAGPASSGAIQIKTNGYVGGSSNRYLRLGWKDNNASFSPVLSINDDLNVGIGTTTPDAKLAVNGTIHSKEVKVDLTGWPDYVFKKEYILPTLEEVEKHIAEKGHLENIPSEEEVLKNGVNLGEMNAKLLQKIEELTLYSIEQNKKIEAQAKEIEALKNLALRITKIENELSQK